VLLLRRIHVRYRLQADEDRREAAERAHEHHHARCPVYRSIGGCVEITTELELAPA
jgi:uncharacterized OsmC-like protein